MTISLFDLPPGKSGIIHHIEGENRLKQRLAEMGFIRGSAVTLDRTAPLGDPRAYTLHGYQVSLRNAEARSILLDDSLSHS